MKIVKNYIRVKKIKQLSKEEIYELIGKAQKGDIEARNKIVEHNFPLVMHFMRRVPSYYLHTLGYDDLFHEGVIGMIKAIRKFDISKETEFSTYSMWWIKQHINRYIDDNKEVVRTPIYATALQKKFFKLKEQDHYKTDDFYIKLVARQMKVGVKAVRMAIKHKVSIISTDVTYPDGNTLQIENFLDQDSLEIQDINVERLFKYIGEKETFILKMRMENYTLEETSLELGLSRERVRQIQEIALRKLRTLLRKEI